MNTFKKCTYILVICLGVITSCKKNPKTTTKDIGASTIENQKWFELKKALFDPQKVKDRVYLIFSVQSKINEEGTPSLSMKSCNATIIHPDGYGVTNYHCQDACIVEHNREEPDLFEKNLSYNREDLLRFLSHKAHLNSPAPCSTTIAFKTEDQEMVGLLIKEFHSKWGGIANEFQCFAQHTKTYCAKQFFDEFKEYLEGKITFWNVQLISNYPKNYSQYDKTFTRILGQKKYRYKFDAVIVKIMRKDHTFPYFELTAPTASQWKTFSQTPVFGAGSSSPRGYRSFQLPKHVKDFIDNKLNFVTGVFNSRHGNLNLASEEIPAYYVDLKAFKRVYDPIRKHIVDSNYGACGGPIFSNQKDSQLLGIFYRVEKPTDSEPNRFDHDTLAIPIDRIINHYFTYLPDKGTSIPQLRNKLTIPPPSMMEVVNLICQHDSRCQQN